MAPWRRNASHATTTTTLKAQSISARGAGPSGQCPLILMSAEGQSSPLTTLGQGQCFYNQLIQMHSDLQKQMDEKQAEAARDHEKAALEREAKIHFNTN